MRALGLVAAVVVLGVLSPAAARESEIEAAVKDSMTQTAVLAYVLGACDGVVESKATDGVLIALTHEPRNDNERAFNEVMLKSFAQGRADYRGKGLTLDYCNDWLTTTRKKQEAAEARIKALEAPSR